MPLESPSETALPTTPQPTPATTKLPTNIQPQPPLPDNHHSWRTRPYPVTIPTSSASPRWQQLIQDPTELDIQSFSRGWEADFHAGTLNIGDSLRDRITDNTFIFAATGMDYLCLQDTRQTKREGLAIANTIWSLLPPSTLIFQAPISKQRPTDPDPIGRQMILISHR